LPHQPTPRSERLGVAEVHGTAVGVVQVEVPRTAVVAHQLRITVADVHRADRDLRVPRCAPAHLDVVGGVATHLGTRDQLAVLDGIRIDLAFDVVDVPGQAPVAPAPVVGQVDAGVGIAVTARPLDRGATAASHVVL